YKAGHCDGMADCYEFSRSPFGEDFGSIQYINVSRTNSDELTSYAIAEAFRRFGADLVGVEVPSVEDYRRGSLYLIPVCVGMWNVCDLQALIRSIACHTSRDGDAMVTPDLD